MPEISRFFGVRIAMFLRNITHLIFMRNIKISRPCIPLVLGKGLAEKCPPKIENITTKWARQYKKELQ